MQEAGWKNGILKITEWITRLAWINILWIIHTILGLGLVGILPATAAMFAVLRKWIHGNLTASVASEFWYFYKKEFWKANAAGFILLLVGYILYIDLTVYEFGASEAQQILQLLLYIITFFYLLTVSFFFPVYVHYELKWYQYMKYAILTAFSFPLRALSMLVIGYGFVFLTGKLPAITFFFTGSGTAYMWLMVALPLFEKMISRETVSVFRQKGV